MECPDWVPASAWARLAAVLAREPEHALDVLEDLRAVSQLWSDALRERLLLRFVLRAEAGRPLPAALVLALADLLGEAQ